MIDRPGRHALAAAALAGLVAAASIAAVRLAGAPGTSGAAHARTGAPVARPRAVSAAAARVAGDRLVGAVTDPLPHPAAPSAAARPVSDLPAGPGARVAIPSQGVVAPVGVCHIVDGGLEPPSDVHRTCRWAGGAPLAAARGTTTLTGHINWVGQGTGAFGKLASLHPGEAIVTRDGHGGVRRWVVAGVSLRDKEDGIDLAAFAGRQGPRTLYLVSCGGPFDAAAGSYLDNVYVRAVPAARP